MSQYVVTFFARDEHRRRYKMFPEQRWYTQDEDGRVTDTGVGMLPEMILKMCNWFDAHPLSSMFRSYGIKWALTSLCSSSIVVDLRGDCQEREDEILVTLQMFAGPDVRIKNVSHFDNLPPKPNRAERMLKMRSKDRYAR